MPPILLAAPMIKPPQISTANFAYACTHTYLIIQCFVFCVSDFTEKSETSYNFVYPKNFVKCILYIVYKIHKTRYITVLYIVFQPKFRYSRCIAKHNLFLVYLKRYLSCKGDNSPKIVLFWEQSTNFHE